jgi:pimeloyl-ACP methyl ester carboxylesterase
MKVSTFFGILLLATVPSVVMGTAMKSEHAIPVHPLEGMEHEVYYAAPRPLTEGFDGEVAVIMIHGWGSGVTVPHEQLVLQNTLDEAYVLSPMYPRAQILEKYGVERGERAVWNDSWPKDLTIPGSPDDDWRGGGDAAGTELSSFDVVDTLLSRLSDRRLYPNLKKIALVGFSAGGQFVGRYVASGKGRVRDGIILRYVAMSPSTYLIPDPDDVWHYGLKNRPRYSADLTENQIMDNLHTRRCMHGCGSADTLEKSLDKTVSAMKQGENRYRRFLNFRTIVSKDSLWNASTTFHTFDSVGHAAVTAYADPFFVDYVMNQSFQSSYN